MSPKVKNNSGRVFFPQRRHLNTRSRGGLCRAGQKAVRLLRISRHKHALFGVKYGKLFPVMGIVRHIVVALVALMFTLFTWLGGGIVPRWLAPWVPWVTLLLIEVMLLLPEQRRTESLLEARTRVWKSLLRDPLTWLSLALVAFLTVQWLNAYTFLEWDPAKQAWEVVSPAFEWLRHPDTAALLERTPANPRQATYLRLPDSLPVPWLPHALRADEAVTVLAWFAPVLTALLAMRHATLRHSKRMLCAFICAMTSVLAVAGIFQYLVGGTFLYWGMESHAFFFATFGYPNHAACFFPAVMALALGMLLWKIEHREHSRMPAVLYIGTFILCAVSAILSGSRAGVLFTLAIIGFAALYIPLRYFESMSMRLRVALPALLFTLAAIVIGSAAFRIYAVSANERRAAAIASATTPEAHAAAFAMPTYRAIPAVDAVLKEIGETDWAHFIRHPMLMRSGYQGILALRQLEDYPLFGSGAWSFRWLNINYINTELPEEREWLRNRKVSGQANVHNDTLQFLAEHGWVGFGLMLGCIAALVLPFFKTLLRSPSVPQNDAVADRIWFNRICAYCIFALAATTLIAAHSFIDLVFRSPACMMLYGLLFVCAEGFVPRRTVLPKTAPSAQA